MKERQLTFTLRVFDNTQLLPAEDASLLNAAFTAIPNAYAPYSNFRVAAAVLLANGEVVTGTNQENAAFPVGICAEGTALSAASALYPDVAIKKIAITVKSGTHIIDHPVAPCGICRQRLLEYESRFNSPIEILLTGETGEVYSISTVKDILPLNFSKSDL
jgi:cytidine deaminase